VISYAVKKLPTNLKSYLCRHPHAVGSTGKYRFRTGRAVRLTAMKSRPVITLEIINYAALTGGEFYVPDHSVTGNGHG